MKVPDANDVLKSRGESAIRTGFDRAPRFEARRNQQEENSRDPPYERIQVIDAATLLPNPPPNRVWHVVDRIPGNDVTLLGGDGGEGKTTLSLQLAYCTTARFPWIGFDVRQGPAIYFTAEEPVDEMHFRLSQLSKSIDTVQQDLAKLKIITRAGKDSVLATFGPGGIQPTHLFEDLVEIVAEERPALLVLDAVADVFGGDEMKRPQVRSFINLLRGRLAMPFNCAVVLPSHPSLSGMKSGLGYSGSTHWNNSVRSRYYLTSPKDGSADQRELQLQKNNRGKRGEKVWLRYKDGYFVVASPGSAMDAASMEKAKTTFLNLLRRFNGQGRRVSNKPGKNYAPTLFALEPEAKGISKQNLSTAMTVLFAEYRLEVAQEGPPSKLRSYLIEAQGG